MHPAERAAKWTPEVVRDHLRRRVRTTITGNNPDTSPGNDTYFGSHTLTWQHLRDPSSLIAGIRALLQQTAHPHIAAAVQQHSTYTGDPLGRLHRTVEYMSTVTYQNRDDVNITLNRIRSAHDNVHGFTDTGEHYDANNPTLSSYVHATILDSLAVCWQHHHPQTFTAGDIDTLISE